MLDNHNKIESKTQKIFQEQSLNSNNPHNPPNDYGMVLCLKLLYSKGNLKNGSTLS